MDATARIRSAAVRGASADRSFNLLNYAAGITGMPARSYVAATALGIIPGTIAYTALGSTVTRPGSLPLFVALAAVVLLTLLLASDREAESKRHAVRENRTHA